LDSLILNTIVISAESLVGKPYQYRYLIAGFEVLCQTEIALVSMFQVPLSEESPEALSIEIDASQQAAAKEVYAGLGSFSGGSKHVRACYDGAVQYLEIEDVDFSVTDFSQRLIQLRGEIRADVAKHAEIILGPPLLCLMAFYGVFSFHAGAVTTSKGAVLFVGESGRGKSTLSQACESQAWHRLGDDIMPLMISGDECLLQPRFPQLKRDTQYLNEQVVDLNAIFRIAPPSENNQIQTKQLTGVQAILTLSRHIASSRVFSDDLLKNKMELIAVMAKTVPIIDLAYQRDMSKLSDLRQYIVDVIDA